MEGAMESSLAGRTERWSQQPELEDSLPPEPPAVLVDRLRQLAEHARSLETSLAGLEDAAAGEIEKPLLPAVGELLRQVRALLDQLLGEHETAGGGEEGLTGLLLFALYELRSREEAFRRQRADPHSLGQLIGCGRLLRTALRALVAVQQALCERYGLPPTLSLEPELQVALQVRAEYDRFRREIEEIRTASDPEAGDPTPALLSAATSIALLTGRDIFRQMRLQDRIHLRGLQARILGWRAGRLPAEEARPLWQDLYAFTQLIQQVNRRQELLEHDRLAGRP